MIRLAGESIALFGAMHQPAVERDLARTLDYHKIAALCLSGLKTSVRPPNGSALRSDMPWKDISSAFSDDELKTLYAYLRTLKPVQR